MPDVFLKSEVQKNIHKIVSCWQKLSKFYHDLHFHSYGDPAKFKSDKLIRSWAIVMTRIIVNVPTFSKSTFHNNSVNWTYRLIKQVMQQVAPGKNQISEQCCKVLHDVVHISAGMHVRHNDVGWCVAQTVACNAAAMSEDFAQNCARKKCKSERALYCRIY